MIAVWGADKIVCAQIIINNATVVARTPVIKKAMSKELSKCIVEKSSNKIPENKDRIATTID